MLLQKEVSERRHRPVLLVDALPSNRGWRVAVLRVVRGPEGLSRSTPRFLLGSYLRCLRCVAINCPVTSTYQYSVLVSGCSGASCDASRCFLFVAIFCRRLWFIELMTKHVGVLTEGDSSISSKHFSQHLFHRVSFFAHHSKRFLLSRLHHLFVQGPNVPGPTCCSQRVGI